MMCKGGENRIDSGVLLMGTFVAPGSGGLAFPNGMWHSDPTAIFTSDNRG
jgi:hypothetical protein